MAVQLTHPHYLSHMSSTPLQSVRRQNSVNSSSKTKPKFLGQIGRSHTSPILSYQSLVEQQIVEDDRPPPSPLNLNRMVPNISDPQTISRISRSKSTTTAAVRASVGRKNYAQPVFTRSCSTTDVKEIMLTDVFLGGSCNPTTWRKDTAIPILNEHSISFYNPQVDNWHHGLVELEATAKEHSKIVFFVIDNSTRSIVSMIEAAEYICRSRLVVLVIQPLTQLTIIDGSPLSSSELEDLNEARSLLKNLAADHGVKCFIDIRNAIESIATSILTEKEKPITHVKSTPRLRKQSSVILSIWAEKIKPQHKLLKRSLSNSKILLHQDSSEMDVMSLESIDDFNTVDNKRLDAGVSSDKEAMLMFQAHRAGQNSHARAIYLGGSMRNESSWRTDLAIPMLMKAGISYVNPRTMNKGRQNNVPFDPYDFAELVLFVINANSHSSAIMTEAVTYISSGRAIILVIEDFENGTKMHDGRLINGREYRDFSRGRVYLKEAAERNHVQIFTSVQTAVQSIIDRLESSRNHRCLNRH